LIGIDGVDVVIFKQGSKNYFRMVLVSVRDVLKDQLTLIVLKFNWDAEKLEDLYHVIKGDAVCMYIFCGV